VPHEAYDVHGFADAAGGLYNSAWSSSIIVPPAALTTLDAEFLAGELEGDFVDGLDGHGDQALTSSASAFAAANRIAGSLVRGAPVDDGHVILGAPSRNPTDGLSLGAATNTAHSHAYLRQTPAATATSALLASHTSPAADAASAAAAAAGPGAGMFAFVTPLQYSLHPQGDVAAGPATPRAAPIGSPDAVAGADGQKMVLVASRVPTGFGGTAAAATASAAAAAAAAAGSTPASGSAVLIAAPAVGSPALNPVRRASAATAAADDAAAAAALEAHLAESESTVVHPLAAKTPAAASSRRHDAPLAHAHPRPPTVAPTTHSSGNSGSSNSSSSGGGAGLSGAARSAAQRISRSLQPYRALLRRGHKLGEMRATAICGNDATGSLFYMVGQTTLEAGVFAPLSVFFVTLVLYLFRGVYGEAVTSLPLNGGAYNVLLNTTKKSTAAIAAVLTLLSYTATAVVCAAEALHYLQRAVGFDKEWILYGTLLLLVLFAVLNFIGIGESASVALGIFAAHILSMSLLILLCFLFVIRVAAGHGPPGADTGDGFPLFWLERNYAFTSTLLQPKLGLAIFYGFSAAMLGVTGFESSANYIEEQRPGVFVKTLRNMWVLCSVFNTLLSFAAVLLLDLQSVMAQGHVTTIVGLLAGHVVEGSWLDTLVCVDAFLVLAGGVLTAYVGVTGLVRRLAMDRCLPQFFLTQNRFRQTNHWIIVSFCVLCCSMYIILDQNVTSLSQTYSLAFLFVMGLFALGVMLIKVKRSTLVSEVTTTWSAAMVAFVAVVAGIVGAVLRDPDIVFVFALYFSIAWALILVMFFRLQVLKLCAMFTSRLPCRCCSGRRRRRRLASSPAPAAGAKGATAGVAAAAAGGAGYGSVDGTPLLGGPAAAAVGGDADADSDADAADAGCGGAASGDQWSVTGCLLRAMEGIRDAPMGFFTKNGDLSVLNKAVLYIRDNEDCSKLRIIHVFEHESRIPPFLAHNVQMLNEQYPKLRFDLVLVKGRFTPAMVAYISVKLGIGRNHLFITSPQPGFALRLEDLGGVRLITH
jgi:amino acid transporter